MQAVQAIAALSTLCFLSSCASNTATGNAIEVRLIEPSQGITVLWDVGQFDDKAIQNALLKSGTALERFEACTNYFITQAFLLRGYSAEARKVRNAEALRTPGIRTPYVLLLHNTYARGMKDPTIVTLPNSTVVLTYEGRLHETKRGWALWTVNTWLSSNAENNGKFALGLVDAMAADGFLANQPSSGLNHAHATHDGSQALLNCPKNIEAATYEK